MIKSLECAVDVSRARQAERNISQVIAGCRLKAEALADRQCLLVIRKGFLEPSQEQVNTAYVAERVAFPPLEMRRAMQFQRSLVLFERSLIIALLIEYESKIVAR